MPESAASAVADKPPGRPQICHHLQHTRTRARTHAARHARMHTQSHEP